MLMDDTVQARRESGQVNPPWHFLKRDGTRPSTEGCGLVDAMLPRKASIEPIG